ncbi:MAG: LytS/YehU family sensor histidine kinase [Polaribacter sp.]|jgi:LytS/YehU family sensor histidine kinase
MKIFIKTYWALLLMSMLLGFTSIVKLDSSHRINIYLLILVTFGFIFLIQWFLLKRKTEKLKSINIQSELDLLKSQIDPHFYFNTLNNLYGLAKRKSDKTPEVILKLSEIMRYVIYKGKEPKVHIEEELTYLENYIELQTLRLHKSIDIVFDKNISDDSIEIAPLLLIIPLENAFKHGVDSVIEDAYININLDVSQTSLYFEVKNIFETEEQNKFQGIGLENLKKRLHHLYKNKHTVTTNIENNEFTFKLTIKL